jgi:hypothetical protein
MPKKILVKCCTGCAKGNHVFIVSKWHNQGAFQKANEVLCQHCLLALTLDETQVVQQGLHHEPQSPD